MDVNIDNAVCEFYGEHDGGVIPNARKMLFIVPVVSVVEPPCRSRS